MLSPTSLIFQGNNLTNQTFFFYTITRLYHTILFSFHIMDIHLMQYLRCDKLKVIKTLFTFFFSLGLLMRVILQYIRYCIALSYSRCENNLL